MRLCVYFGFLHFDILLNGIQMIHHDMFYIVVWAILLGIIYIVN
jgi:hypothetical protein